MKSAYEIALAKLEAESGPTRKLSDEEKAKIAEIDRKYESKAAEVKLEFESRIVNAQAQDREEVQRRLAEELARLESERERAKNAVWNQCAE